MPIIDLKKVNKTIQEIKKLYEKLLEEEKKEVDFWYQRYRTSFMVIKIKR